MRTDHAAAHAHKGVTEEGVAEEGVVEWVTPHHLLHETPVPTHFGRIRERFVELNETYFERTSHEREAIDLARTTNERQSTSHEPKNCKRGAKGT